jgi:hypothetical protein
MDDDPTGGFTLARPPARRVEAMLRRGPQALRPTVFEARQSARVVAGVASLLAATTGTMFIRGVLAGNSVLMLFGMVAVAATVTVVWVLGAPGRYGRDVIDPLALMLVAGCTWDDVRAAVATAGDRERLPATCRAAVAARTRTPEPPAPDG